MDRVAEPPLSDSITAGDLDAEVRRDLRGLQKDTAESVARHLVAAGSLVDEDPESALAHARFARHRASRISVVREAAGIAAYHAGEWTEALSELRAARRMGGGPGHLAVMADIERALGRPERALELTRGPEVRELGRAESIELAIVGAGARRDLGELDAAVVSLQLPELDPARREPWSARLFYAYADNLLAAGREPEALQWFLHAADADSEGETDADRRLAELTGEPLPDDDDIRFEVEEPADDPAPPGPGGSDPDEVQDQPRPEADDQRDRAHAAGLADLPASVDEPVGRDEPLRGDEPAGEELVGSAEVIGPDEPAGGAEPLAASAPGGDNEPAGVEEPVGAGEPVAGEESAGTSGPVDIDEPVGMQEPVGGDEPTGGGQEPVGGDDVGGPDEPLGADPRAGQAEPAVSVVVHDPVRPAAAAHGEAEAAPAGGDPEGGAPAQEPPR